MALGTVTPYCTIADVQDLMSAEGLSLRLNDDNRGSGQTVTVTATAAQSAGTIQVAPLQAAMAAGTSLDFGGAAMPAIVQAVMTTPALKGATQLLVISLPAQIPSGAVAEDFGINVYEAARATKGITYASDRVNFFIQPRYPPSVVDLTTSWTVNRWTATLAARWIAQRRGNGVPKSLEAQYKEALEDMKEVRAGSAWLPDIGTATSEWPAWSNIRVDPSWFCMKARVETTISEATPVQGYAQSVDWASQVVEL